MMFKHEVTCVQSAKATLARVPKFLIHLMMKVILMLAQQVGRNALQTFDDRHLFFFSHVFVIEHTMVVLNLLSLLHALPHLWIITHLWFFILILLSIFVICFICCVISDVLLFFGQRTPA